LKNSAYQYPLKSEPNIKSERPKCVALVSGGPDSIGYAAIQQKKGYEIYPLTVDYGQKGLFEIEVARSICHELQFQPIIILMMNDLKKIWPRTQLTDETVLIEGTYSKTVVVPIRNIVMLSAACAYALSIGAKRVIYGAHISDIGSGEEPLYPDCTPEAAIALERVLDVAHFPVGKSKLEIWSPAREGWTKAVNISKAAALMGDVIFKTWSCYDMGPIHCGICESCQNRKAAFKSANIKDLTEYRN
jgi:7-cyano-7-deazaguanine synthase